MSLRIIDEVEQGTEEWHALRRGIVTASVVGKLITGKTLKLASNDEARGLTRSLVAERITGYTEPTYVSADMERGNFDEPIARDLYSEHFEPVAEVGFMMRDFGDFTLGYTLGYSPDGVVGDDGLIEIKSRRQKKHLQTILENEVPPENMAQCQAGLLVSGRKWLDYVSFCGGMPLFRKRVFPDLDWHAVIVAALARFELDARDIREVYDKRTLGAPPTERIDYDLEMVF